MCEVEFWEVFLKMCEIFLSGFLGCPLVDCRLANLDVLLEGCFLFLIVKVLF